MTNFNRRLWVMGGIAIGVIFVLTLLIAPSNNHITSGSTYSRSPDGYGAWYAYLQKQGVPVRRWEKPFDELAAVVTNEKVLGGNNNSFLTLVRVYPVLSSLRIYPSEKAWLEKGNTLVVLGVKGKVTEASFTTLQESPVGKVKIATKRRYDPNNYEESLDLEPVSLLQDNFGATVWEFKQKKGKLIQVVTPYLAANAYQDNPANYEFLNRLVRQDNNQVFVDEYLHGYRDKNHTKKEGSSENDDWLVYLLKTPLFPAFLQGCLVLLVGVLAAASRFGQRVYLKSPVVDNSEAYIRATAGVLEKAKSTDFVVDMVGKEEQLELQKMLGLGPVLLEADELVSAWVRQTGKPKTELQQLLQMKTQKRRIREGQLLSWLDKWQKLRRQVSGGEKG